MSDLLSFYKNKHVLITGHTGFKGAWLCRALLNAGASVTGFALAPPTNPSLWELLGMGGEMRSVIGDVRDLNALKAAFDDAHPEMVFHLAAQPIVRESYRNPVYTYETNVIGTVNLLECVRLTGSVKSVVNVTTDKVYEETESNVSGYRENERLNGFEPYSNSKSCSELVTGSYIRSFLAERGVAVSTARAGNVIGGGDFAADRIFPDCVRAAEKGGTIVLRNPESIRPYQHVLEAICAYLLVAQKQWETPESAGSYNIGPDDADCVTTRQLARMFCEAWGNNASFEAKTDSNAPHEAGFLKLDCSKIKGALGWRPRWDIKTAVAKAVEWEKARLQGTDITGSQIEAYIQSAWEHSDET